MLIRQDQSASVESTTIINQLVADCAEHIHVNLGQVQSLKQNSPLVRLVKVNAFSNGYEVSAGAFLFLPLLIA